MRRIRSFAVLCLAAFCSLMASIAKADTLTEDFESWPVRSNVVRSGHVSFSGGVVGYGDFYWQGYLSKTYTTANACVVGGGCKSFITLPFAQPGGNMKFPFIPTAPLLYVPSCFSH